MKIILIFFCCFCLAACSNDDKATPIVPTMPVNTITLIHDEKELVFKDIKFNSPYDDYDLWVVGNINFEETETGQFKYLISLTFKLEGNEYKMQSFNFTVTEKLSSSYYYSTNYYAFQTGVLASNDFFVSTVTDPDDNRIYGNFSGILNSSADGDTLISDGNLEIHFENIE